ncbi:MAG: NAD-dependent epimerase/dehydratase family protein [Alphaproteobacteria bacterium]|nr:MAG: NAD-dependent epimerase/dehydratase family protein [Alphaproteobacteria bacterium]
MATVFVTGSAGFIGFHLCRALLAEGFRVAGYDGMTPYYDVGLKRARCAILSANPAFTQTEAMLEDAAALGAAVRAAAPRVIVHLAAQAGVRHSLEAPRAFVEANVTGSFNLLEAARTVAPAHLLIASTSSAYGASDRMPFREIDPAEHPLTVYAATKRAVELLSHAWAHLHGLPTTLFRFFTVYGSWGRPDMAPMKFLRAALAGEPISVHNHGRMRRDFTHVSDIVSAIRLLIDRPPPPPGHRPAPVPGDTLSPVAPWRLVNIGNGSPVELGAFIDQLEAALGRPIARRMVAMQPGEMTATWADTGLLRALTGFTPATPLAEGVAELVAWYRDHYGDAPRGSS